MVNGRRDKARAVASNSLSVKRSGESSRGIVSGGIGERKWGGLPRVAPRLRFSPPIAAGAHFERYVPAAGTMTTIRESVRCSPLFTRRFCLFRSWWCSRSRCINYWRERERVEFFLPNIYISEPLSNVTRVDYTPAFHRPSRGDPLFLHPFLSSCSKIDAFEQDFHRRDRIFFLSPSSNANHRFPPRRNPVL